MPRAGRLRARPTQTPATTQVSPLWWRRAHGQRIAWLTERCARRLRNRWPDVGSCQRGQRGKRSTSGDLPAGRLQLIHVRHGWRSRGRAPQARPDRVDADRVRHRACGAGAATPRVPRTAAGQHRIRCPGQPSTARLYRAQLSRRPSRRAREPRIVLGSDGCRNSGRDRGACDRRASTRADRGRVHPMHVQPDSNPRSVALSDPAGHQRHRLCRSRCRDDHGRRPTLEIVGWIDAHGPHAGDVRRHRHRDAFWIASTPGCDHQVRAACRQPDAPDHADAGADRIGRCAAALLCGSLGRD